MAESSRGSTIPVTSSGGPDEARGLAAIFSRKRARQSVVISRLPKVGGPKQSGPDGPGHRLSTVTPSGASTGTAPHGLDRRIGALDIGRVSSPPDAPAVGGQPVLAIGHGQGCERDVDPGGARSARPLACDPL